MYVYSNEDLKKVTINFGTYIINKSKRAFLVNNIRTYILYMIMKWYIVAQIFLRLMKVFVISMMNMDE